VHISKQKQGCNKKGISVGALVSLVAVLISVGLLLYATVQLTTTKTNPLKETFMKYLLGSAVGILEVKICDYPNSGTNQMVYFCWGLKCARLNKIGPDFKRGKVRRYNLGMREEEIEDFYFMLASEPVKFGDLGQGFQKMFTKPWYNMLEKKGWTEKTLGSILIGIRQSRVLLEHVGSRLAEAVKTLKGQQCLCIKSWNLKFKGRTIMNVTYGQGRVLWKGSTGFWKRFANQELDLDEAPPVTEPIKPHPNLIYKRAKREGNLVEGELDNGRIDCGNYE